MNRVTNPGKTSRTNGRNMSILETRIKSLEKQLAEAKRSVSDAKYEAEVAQRSMKLMRETYAGHVIPDGGGYEVTYTIKVQPYNFVRGVNTTQPSLGSQYETAMIAIKHSMKRGLDVVYDVCPGLDTTALLDVKPLEVEEAQ